MSKRTHTEAVNSIHLKLIDVEGDAGEQQKKEKSKTIGIFPGSNYGETKRIQLGTDSTLPIDGSALSTIAIHGMQNWMDGIGTEVVQCLSKLAEQQGTDQKLRERRKYCLNFALSFAFRDEQEGTFGKNLSTLLAVPGLLHSVGAFSYSEGGNLAEFLARFPQLLAEPNFPERYDVHVYCENDTLVEDYFADVKHWVIEMNKPLVQKEAKKTVRQCRLKFVIDRADTAEEMLKLFKEDFDKANNATTDGRTFVVRIDCPGFSLDEFCVNNDKTGEVLALAFKCAQVLKADNDDEEMTNDNGEMTSDRTAAPEGKKSRCAGESKKNGEAEDEAEDDDGEESVVEWKTYQLVRCPPAELEQLSAIEVPFLNRSLSIIY
uniref:UBX domain-containing protein n=1 Tax=Globodera rostochiensis TaxID=31243 RepID=A0A914I5E8_GLORO